MTETNEDPFVNYLRRLVDDGDRAALAALRQGFVSPLRALPYVARFIPETGGRRAEDNLILVSGLFALHPVTSKTSLASAMRRLADKSDSIELRFRALLDCDREDLPNHLRHAVALAASSEIPIDFEDLHRAIRGWDHESRFVQRRWARDYWSSLPDTRGDDVSRDSTADSDRERAS
jgi:CRISPR system Cascade subunit CasB